MAFEYYRAVVSGGPSIIEELKNLERLFLGDIGTCRWL